jgi:peptide/nickel transport system permease protein
MTRFEDYKIRLSGFWKQYRKSKMGLTGLAIIIFFVVVALIAPVLSLWPQPVLVNLAPRLSAPMWLLPFNPYGFRETSGTNNSAFATNANGWVYNESIPGEGYIVVGNPDFRSNASGWTYSESGTGFSIVSGAWTNQTGNTGPGGSGPGCYQVIFNDTSILNAYGDTDVYVEYDFLFNASKYPAGFVKAHPSSLSITYSLKVIIDNTVDELGAADMIFSLELTNSSGPAIVLYSRRYFSPTPISVWTPSSSSMSTQTITQTFTTNDTITIQIHLLFRDPITDDTPNITVQFDDIQCFIQAEYTNATSSALIDGRYNSIEGNTAPGCFEFTFNDNSTTTSYSLPTAWIQTGFTWNYYERPQAVYLNYYYKVVAAGDIGDAVLNIITEMYVQENGHLELVVLGMNINKNMSWIGSPTAVMNAFMIHSTFDIRGTLWARYSVQVTDPTPQDTPSFTVYLDDCNVQILGAYYGLLGSGQFGEDLWSQLLWGSRIAMLVGLSAAFIFTFLGLIVGLISGYFGGLVDELLMRVTDFFLVIPGLPLMIVLAAILTPHWWNIVLVIALVGWTGTARLVRSQVLAERQKAYIEAARAIGASDLYIIFRHILPNVTPLLFAQITLGVAGSILSEAALSFLGLTHPDDVSWGRMLFQASQAGAYGEGAWWYVFFPGLCIVLLSLSFTLVGYAVDEILNPRLRIRKE